MPSSVVMTRGDLRVSQRTTNVHPEHWDKQVERQTPLDQYPMVTMLDKMAQGDPVTSRVFHYWDKPFNALTGNIHDVYTDTGFTSAHSGAAASGTTLVVRPTAGDLNRLQAVEECDQIEIHSTSVYGTVKALVVGIERAGTFACFTIQTLETDTNSVLAGTGLTWTVLNKSEDEVFELGEAIAEHETEYYNYIGTDSEPFSISHDELDEATRTEEDLKAEKETEALMRLNQRRENAFFEGVRLKVGDRFWSGGLRYFLGQHESSNIINWRTDTTYSAATDTVLGGTLPFLRRVFEATRKWSRPGATKQLHVSQTVRGIIDNCVLNSGQYTIDYSTNRYGINVAKIRGLDQEIEIVENPLFVHYPSRVYTAYLIEPEQIRRRQKKTDRSGMAFSRGLCRVPWSDFKKTTVDGENFISRAKGGWVCKEGFQIRRLAAHAIIDNLGIDKP